MVFSVVTSQILQLIERWSNNDIDRELSAWLLGSPLEECCFTDKLDVKSGENIQIFELVIEAERWH